jgi:alkaline phosphatase/alkaline phosphatase D
LPDNKKKSVWGAEQEEWLKKTLLGSDATFKLLVSPTPMIGPDDKRKTDNHCNIGGFRTERKMFFDWLTEHDLIGNGFYVICGDRHWQYHSIHPSGVEEFSCGAIIDENSRLGRKPGDPKSTDPNARIKQPYNQEEKSGGFLYITVGKKEDIPVITFSFRNEHGKVLYEIEKTE